MVNLKPMSLNALVTTVTDDMPITAAANMGLRRILKKGKSIPKGLNPKEGG
jgi:hypothetical protein